MQSRLNTPIRQALFYGCLLAASGASLPFMPVWLKSKGISAADISIILAVPHLLRAISGPVIGVWADQYRIYRTPMILLGLIGAVCYALLLPSAGWDSYRFWAFLLFWTLGYSCTSFVNPLIDGMTIQIAREEGFNYGAPRAFGSAVFIVASIVVGYLLTRMPTDTIVIWVTVAMVMVALAGQFVLEPRVRKDFSPEHNQTKASVWQRMKPLFAAKGYLLLLLAVGLLQATHTFYYAFSALIWKADGIGSDTIGQLWAFGVLAEIAFMWLGGGLRRALGPWRMVVLGALAALLRWSIMIWSPPLWALWPLQALHMFSFAAVYMGGLDLVHRLSPKGQEILGQTVHSAYAYGVMMGIGTLIAGWAFKVYGAYGYGVMALLALFGLLASIWLYVSQDRLSPQGG